MSDLDKLDLRAASPAVWREIERLREEIKSAEERGRQAGLEEVLHICEERSARWLAEAEKHAGRNNFFVLTAQARAAISIGAAIRALSSGGKGGGRE